MDKSIWMWKDQEKEHSRQSQWLGWRLRSRKELGVFEEAGQGRLVSRELLSHYLLKVQFLYISYTQFILWIKLGRNDDYLEFSFHQFPCLYAGVKLYLPLKAATLNYPAAGLLPIILFVGNNTQSFQTLKRSSNSSFPSLTNCVFLLPFCLTRFMTPPTSVLPLSRSTRQMPRVCCECSSFLPKPIFLGGQGFFYFQG